MIIKIMCPQCGQEKEVEVKVPKYCSKECRLANLKASRKKVEPVEPITEPTNDIPPEVTTENQMVPPSGTETSTGV